MLRTGRLRTTMRARGRTGGWVATRAALLALASLAGTGCGGALGGAPEDAAVDADAGPSADAGERDATTDATVDVDAAAPGVDATIDAQPDGPADAASDAAPDATLDAPPDAPPDAGAPVGLQDPGNWSVFDASSVVGAGFGYIGALFDGRYAYFVPHWAPPNGSPNGTVLRYDTTAAFPSSASWSAFDATTVDAGARGFAGGAFDGRYAYFSPTLGGSVVTRYDTSGSFGDPAAWSTYDAWSTDAGTSAFGHVGAVFDGRYVYFPTGGQNSGPPTIERYDTTASFADPAAWTALALASVVPGPSGSFSGTFDGRYVYFAPNGGGSTSHALRYDTQAAFDQSTSWVSFDVAQLGAGVIDFAGNVFDGRYVYYVPLETSSNQPGAAVRYDTQADFTSPASWSTFEATTVDAKADGFAGGGFDGRYVYFIPFEDTHVARYDTHGPFGSASSWTTFDVASLGADAKEYWGCAFDGRWLYLSPYTFLSTQSPLVLRFDTQTTPPSLPPTYHGSFF